MSKIKAIIIGASGYTGAELLRLLVSHPNVEITALVAESNAGRDITDLYPSLFAANFSSEVSVLQKLHDVSFEGVDVAFCCLPHATSQAVISKLPKNLKVIDLSADFRLSDSALYEKWYGEHTAPEIQAEAAYGLTEIYRDKIANARVVACPGCYPTSMLLALMPIIDLLDKDNIIIDAKSGVTGAGRKVSESFLFNEVNEGVGAYAVGGHRHSAELVDNLGVEATFVPHLIPMNRGIISTIYAKCDDVSAARNALVAKYADEEFVQILPEGKLPSTHQVRGTNYCFINIFEGQKKGWVTIVSVIDNLCKGSSGQAIQNMNLMFGLEESVGLKQLALFP